MELCCITVPASQPVDFFILKALTSEHEAPRLATGDTHSKQVYATIVELFVPPETGISARQWPGMRICNYVYIYIYIVFIYISLYIYIYIVIMYIHIYLHNIYIYIIHTFFENNCGAVCAS